jgi:hypothetical protein
MVNIFCIFECDQVETPLARMREVMGLADLIKTAMVSYKWHPLHISSLTLSSLVTLICKYETYINKYSYDYCVGHIPGATPTNNYNASDVES